MVAKKSDSDSFLAGTVRRAAELVSDPVEEQREILRLQEVSFLPKGIVYLNKGIEGPDGKHIDRMEGYIRTARNRYFIHENSEPLSRVVFDAADYNVMAVIYS